MVELAFGSLGLIPSPAAATIPDSGVSWDYTTWLNIVFLLLAAARPGHQVRPHRRRHDAAHDGGIPEQPGAENGHARHDTHGMTAGHDTDGAHRAPAAPDQAGSPRPGRPIDQGHPRRGHDS